MSKEEPDKVNKLSEIQEGVNINNLHLESTEAVKFEFTSLNTIVLNMEGKVFTYGAYSPCLGRDVDDEENKDYGEVIFDTEAPIVNIVTGKSHVLALAADNCVYAWGK